VSAGPAPDGRRRLIAANWKMNLVRAEAEAFCRALRGGWSGSAAAPEVVVFPSFPLLRPVADALAGSAVEVGAQDLHAEPRGAFTGDVSAAQLVDAGCAWVLCGHSERRRHHGETDAVVGAKASAALAAGLLPMVCVGETREERRSGRTFDVLARQLEALPADPRLVLAYEPVWAIGTGDTATPETAADAHAFLRERVHRRSGEAAARALRIVYGGSVGEENAAELAAQSEVDGFLVGGASLDPARFLAILSALAAPSGGRRGSP
jgi:triosephosphate isomerase